jgi:hypothetical protein
LPEKSIKREGERERERERKKERKKERKNRKGQGERKRDGLGQQGLMDDRAIELLFTQNGLFPRLLRNPAHAYYSPILISIIKSLYISLKPEGHGSHVIDLMFFFFGGQSIQALPIKTYDQFIHLRMKTWNA